MINCPDSLVVSPNDSCLAMVPEITADLLGINGGCPPFSISQSLMPGAEISEDTVITVFVTDSIGMDSFMRDTCMIALQVLDTIPPTLQCLDDIIIELPPNVPGLRSTSRTLL